MSEAPPPPSEAPEPRVRPDVEPEAPPIVRPDIAKVAARSSRYVAVRPLVRAAAVSAILSAVAAFVPEPPPKVVTPASVPAVGSALLPVCGLRAVPEGDTCVPLPARHMPVGPAEAARTPITAKDDAQTVFLPRRPERAADYATYLLPIAADPVRVLAEGAGQERAPGERLGVDLASPRGERVLLAALEGQEDDARVVFVGEDAGVTVATLHKVHDGDATRAFLVIYGHLDRPGPGIVAGMRVHPGEVVAFTGDTGSKGVEQLYFEVRQVRDGALPRLLPDETTVPKARLADDALSIATDPRNVLSKK